MKRNRTRTHGLLALLALCALSWSCRRGSSGGGAGASPTTDFNTFVKAQFDRTTRSAEPATINDRTFVFDPDPGAFDDLLGNP